MRPLDSGVFALSLQRHDAIKTDCGGTSEMALCEIRPAQAPSTETVRFQDEKDDWKAKYYWCCGERACAEQIEATVGAAGWHGFHSVVARGEGPSQYSYIRLTVKRDAFMLTHASPD